MPGSPAFWSCDTLVVRVPCMLRGQWCYEQMAGNMHRYGNGPCTSWKCSHLHHVHMQPSATFSIAMPFTSSTPGCWQQQLKLRARALYTASPEWNAHNGRRLTGLVVCAASGGSKATESQHKCCNHCDNLSNDERVEPFLSSRHLQHFAQGFRASTVLL